VHTRAGPERRAPQVALDPPPLCGSYTFNIAGPLAVLIGVDPGILVATLDELQGSGLFAAK
jgi:hypothetical protein